MSKYRDTKPSLEFYIEKLNKKEYFSMIRFGDGEWNNILKKEYSDSTRINNEMKFYKEAQEDLKKTIHESKECDSFFYGLQNLAKRLFGKKIPDSFDWHECDVFHYASIDGNLPDLIDAMKKWDIVFVGGKYLRKINKIVPYTHFIEIPETDCYPKKDSIVKEILEYGKEKKDTIYCFSASVVTNIFIYELFDDLGKDNWLIDFGSIWDPYVGRQTRSYHRKIKV